MLTADVTREARTLALELGATDFVVKPFDHGEVLLRVANLLETRRLHLRLDDRVRAVADGAPVMLFATNDAGDVTLATGAGLASANLVPEGVLGRSIFDIAVDAPGLHQVLAGALAGRDGSTTARIGSEWCLVRGGPLREGGDQAGGMLCVATIVTEQKAAEDALRSATRRLEAIVAAAPLPMLSIRADGTVDSWNPAAERVFGWDADDVLDRPVPIVTEGAWPGAGDIRRARVTTAADEPAGARPATQRSAALPVAGAEIAGMGRDGALLDLRVWMAALEGLDAGAEMAIIEDVTEAKRVARERNRLGAAVEQMVETMIFVDRAGLVRYVNPAFERTSGWAAAEVVGRHVTAFYEYSPARPVNHTGLLSHDRAEPWEGDIVGRRRDGTRYTIQANITPFHADGEVAQEFVVVGRDVTRERELEEDLARQHRERAVVLAGLERLRPGGSPAETATSIVAEVAGLPHVQGASIVLFDAAGEATPAASIGRARDDLIVGCPMTRSAGAELRDGCARGPWIARATMDGSEPAVASGPAPGQPATAQVWVPLRRDGRLFGALGVVAAETAEQVGDTRILTAALEFGALAGALLGPALDDDQRSLEARSRVRAVIDERRFNPVFQPIVDLESRCTVGYEALTRFADGTPPAAWFADAAATGIGMDLEVATLAAAIAASGSLPPAAWLSLNVSPSLVVERERLGRLLSGLAREIVLEITEHVPIPDYRAVREAVASLDHDVRLAVDDAGAGFASLRHILELRPSVVKLDIHLVRDIASDPARQALVAGMRHFARAAGMRLLAEGVETPAQVETLRSLAVDLGQGFLLGRPAPVASLVSGAPATRGGGAGGRRHAAR